MVLNFVYSTRPTLTWGSFAIRLPYLKVTGLSLSKPQKVILISLTVGVGLVTVLSRYLRRRKRVRPAQPSRFDTSALNRRLRSGIRSPNSEFLSEFQSASPVPQRPHRTRSASVNSDRYSVSEAADSKSTPQLLGTMGVESLETAINYWEDALAAYQSSSGSGAALLSVEEAEFCRSLERVLKAAYVLQDETEHLFLHEHSVLFQTETNITQQTVGYTSGAQTPYSRSSYSFTSADSFVSAQEGIADLEDFADIPIDENLPSLYHGSIKQLDESGIPCRVLRTELVRCQTDIEYLCKLHCIRLACQGMFHLPGAEQWFISAGRSLLADLLALADKDPRDVLEAYDAMMIFVQDQSQRFKLAAEMEHRGVKAVTFYDVVLDFILMDAFEDLTAPPSSVLAVINNRWLSNGFKEGALATAVWSVLKAKRRKLLYPDGFISHFYGIMEHLSPVLAWGFLGPESDLKKSCFIFKEQVEGYLQDIFDFERVRYFTVEEMAEDVWSLARQRRDTITRLMPQRFGLNKYAPNRMVHQYLAVGTDPKASRWRVRPFIITTACEELMDICQLFSLRAAEDLSIKTFSAGTAAQHVLGKGINSSLGLNTIQDPEDKEVAERRLDCRKKLINMKSGNAESEAESGGRTVIQQEDLQEWLDNLQLKLRQACNVPTNPAGPRPTRPSRPGGPAGGTSSQSRSLSLPLSSSPGLSSRPVRKYKLTSGPASSPSIIRPRSINGLADQAAAALTDGQYIERLQVSLQQASVSSLHDRLAERKLLSSQLPAAISAAVRPKTTVKSPTKVRHPSPVKAHRTVKHPSDKASKSSSLPATSPIQPPVKSCKNKGKGNKKGGRHRTDDGSSDSQISNSTSSLSLGNLISRKQRSSDKAESSSSTSTEVEKPVRGRSSFVASDIFDCGQTVDDIYQAAEHLLLPPARRDVNQTDQSTVQYESQLVHRQASAEEEIPEVEDFWGAVPEY